MSIVAERPVLAQVAGPGRRSAVAVAEREARRPAVTAETRDRVLTSGYIAEPRVHLGRRVDEPLGSADAERIGRLSALHHARLVRYLCGRIGWDRRALAEDLVQEMWLELAMRPYQMEEWERGDETLFPLLAFRAKRQLYRYWQVLSNERERVLGAGAAEDDRSSDERLEALADPGPDATVCAVLEALGETGEPGWSPCYAEAVALLPERQREVLELVCVEGTGVTAVAARLGLTQASVQDAYQRALATLRPLLVGPAARTEQGLPVGWERVADRLPEHQREAVELRAQGLTLREVAARLGTNSGVLCRTLRRAVAALEKALADQDRAVRGSVVPDAAMVAAMRAKQDRTRLPEGWERVLDRLPRDQAEVVRLKAQGLSLRQITARLGEKYDAQVGRTFHRAVRSLREMVADRRMDPVEAAPAARVAVPAPRAGSCATRCASGCYLRTARAGAVAS